MAQDLTDIARLKDEIITMGRLLWDKDLASAKNGNISARVDDHRRLITATGTCLGRLTPEDIVITDRDGEPLEKGRVSSEALLHTAIYNAMEGVRAVIHTHLPLTNAYFLEHGTLHPRVFETRLYLGSVPSVEQTTPTVTDPEPVVQALQTNQIVVLRRHGVVAVGETLFDCFCLIQNLEDAVRVEAYRLLFKQLGGDDPYVDGESVPRGTASADDSEKTSRPPDLFSPEHIAAIVRTVNDDETVAALGRQTGMTMTLAVSLVNETGTRRKTWCFRFDEGRITEWGEGDGGASFQIDADEKVWRAVFSGSLDPFVATTQKRMKLTGDFGVLSRWYRPCSRIFELWRRVEFC